MLVLPLALLFTEAGFSLSPASMLTPKRWGKLSRGESYIYRVPSTESSTRARAKRFSATVDYSDIARMDAVIICVPTPLNEHREPDLSYIMNTAEAITPTFASRAAHRAGKHHIPLEPQRKSWSPILEEKRKAG